MSRIRRVRKSSRTNRAIEKVDAEMRAILPSRFRSMQSPDSVPRLVLIGSKVFTLKLDKALADEASMQIVASADTQRDALAAAVTHGAELVIVELEFGGPVQGIFLSRVIMDRAPDCGIMLICRTFTDTVARHLWVYGTESWSVLTGATSKNPAHVAEAVNSAVRGMTWVEPGVRRALAEFGPRPKSIEERRQLMLDDTATTSA